MLLEWVMAGADAGTWLDADCTPGIPATCIKCHPFCRWVVAGCLCARLLGRYRGSAVGDCQCVQFFGGQIMQASRVMRSNLLTACMDTCEFVWKAKGGFYCSLESDRVVTPGFVSWPSLQP